MISDELIEDAETAIEKSYLLGGGWDDCARAATRVVLTAVADDLNEHALRIQFAFQQSAFADLASDREKSAITQQWRDAAEHVRSLLPKEASND